jgi:DNA-binding transcriptional regulator YhcF (GntR family)
VKVAIHSEKLKEGDKLVSIRDLSARFNINPLTIMKAYNQLEYEGFLFSKRGSGYFVKAGDRGMADGKKEMFGKAVADFLKQVGAMGFTVKDLLKELTKYTEGKTND